MSVAAPSPAAVCLPARPAAAPAGMTLGDLFALYGPIPLSRVITDPPPGTATEADVERIRRESGRLCELIDGTLVEKAVSEFSSFVGIEIAWLQANFIKPCRLGWLMGADGFLRLTGRLRAPDMSFIAREQFPDGRFPRGPGYPALGPALAVEVFSPGNTRREMETKRAEYFAAGTRLVWVVFPESQTVEVWTDPATCRTLAATQTLGGGAVLPGFSVPVAALFAGADLNAAGPNAGAGA